MTSSARVFTTKTPTDSYRGAGRPEATFAVERIMDELAAERGMDPLELRQRNWISHAEFPCTTITGLTYDSGNFEAATARAVEFATPPPTPAAVQALNCRGDLGLDVANRVRHPVRIRSYQVKAGLQPSAPCCP